MAYDGANLELISGPLTGAGKTWKYTEAETAANIDALNYFSDAYNRGMRAGDMLYHFNTTDPAAVIVTGHVVNSCTAAAGANVSVGVVVGTGGTSGD